MLQHVSRDLTLLKYIIYDKNSLTPADGLRVPVARQDRSPVP